MINEYADDAERIMLSNGQSHNIFLPSLFRFFEAISFNFERIAAKFNSCERSYSVSWFKSKMCSFFQINMFFEPKIITKCLSLHIRSHIFCNLKPRSGQVAEMKEKHMRFVSSGLPNKDHMPIFFNYLIEIINRHETATSCCIYLEIWFWPLKHIAELACETKTNTRCLLKSNQQQKKRCMQSGDWISEFDRRRLLRSMQRYHWPENRSETKRTTVDPSKHLPIEIDCERIGSRG